MAVQTRAKATRQRIVDSAVDLFYEVGYAATGLSDITAKANVTTGAFYYHFESKEALGAEIIRLAWPLWWDTVERHSGRQPALENLIVLTFDLIDLLKRSRMAAVAQNLNLAFYQRHDDVRSIEAESTQSSFRTLADMIAPDDLRSDITREEMAVQVSMNLFGCHVLSGRLEDSATDRVARSWLTLLRGTVPTARLEHFEKFVTETAANYV